jgi:DNA-directed RNA polymerase specialized sigma24 family protein
LLPQKLSGAKIAGATARKNLYANPFTNPRPKPIGKTSSDARRRQHELKEADREAILLRYFENRQFVEVGAELGLNGNAARMRVARAPGKIARHFYQAWHHGDDGSGVSYFSERDSNCAC